MATSWDSNSTSGVPTTLAGANGKYLHYILIGGGGIGGMTAKSDYSNTSPGVDNDNYLTNNGNATGAHGGSTGGYVEVYVKVGSGVGQIPSNRTIVLSKGLGGKRTDPENSSTPSPLTSLSTRTTLTISGELVAAAQRGQPCNWLLAPENRTQRDNTVPADDNNVNKIIVKDEPCKIVTYACGAPGFLGPDGIYYGTGGSHDDSTPAQDGYWWFEFTDELPSAPFAFTKTDSTYTLTIPSSTSYTHMLITLVSKGITTMPGNAIINFPLLITSLGGVNAVFTVTENSVQVEIGSGLNLKTIIMSRPGVQPVSSNGYLPFPDETKYTLRDDAGIFIDGTLYGAAAPTGAPPSLPYYSYSFTTITSFNSFDHPLAGINYPSAPADLDNAPYNDPDQFEYIHYTLIGGGDLGHWWNTGAQGALLEGYIPFVKTAPLTLSFTSTVESTDPETYDFYFGKNTKLVHDSADETAGGGIMSDGGVTTTSAESIIIQEVMGQPATNGLPGGYSKYNQEVYIEGFTNRSVDAVSFSNFADTTPYINYPDKSIGFTETGQPKQYYGSGGQENGGNQGNGLNAYYTASGVGNAYWEFEFVKDVPATDQRPLKASKARLNKLKNPRNSQYPTSKPQQRPSSNTLKPKNSFKQKFGSAEEPDTEVDGSLANGKRYLHYVLIGPGDAGNGAYCGGAGGYIEAYIDIGGPQGVLSDSINTPTPNFTVTFTQGFASQESATTDTVMTMIDKGDPTNNFAFAKAFGSKGLEGATIPPNDQYTLTIQNIVGKRGTDTTPGAGYLGKDGVIYGGGGSRGSGGSESFPAQDGYWWYEFTDSIPFKNSWDSNNDALTFMTGATIYNEYKFLHYILIGGGYTNNSGNAGGAGGALVEAYLDLEAAGRKNYITFGTGLYDLGDGKGPTDNSYFAFQDINTGTILSLAIAEGGTTENFNTGGTPYPPADNNVDGDLKVYSYTIRSNNGYNPQGSIPAEGYVGNDSYTYGNGGSCDIPATDEIPLLQGVPRGSSYWWFEFTNDPPPPAQNVITEDILMNDPGVTPNLEVSNLDIPEEFRYIHFLLIGEGGTNSEPYGGALVEGYLDMWSLGKYDFEFDGESIDTKFKYKFSTPGSTDLVIGAGASTGATIGVPDLPLESSEVAINGFVYYTRVLNGQPGALNDDDSYAIVAPGYAGVDGNYYGAGERVESENRYKTRYYWFEYSTDVPLSYQWDSNNNALSYPRSNTWFQDKKYFHIVLIGAGNFGDGTTYGDSGTYEEFYVNLSLLTGMLTIQISLSEDGTLQLILKQGNVAISGMDLLAKYSYLIKREQNSGTADAPGDGFTGMDGIMYGKGGDKNDTENARNSYWWFEYTDTIPLPKSWNSNNNSTNAPINVNFFETQFRYLHYVLIGPGSTINAGGYLESYLDMSEEGANIINDDSQTIAFTIDDVSGCVFGVPSGGTPLAYYALAFSGSNPDTDGGTQSATASTITNQRLTGQLYSDTSNGYIGKDGVQYGSGGDLADEVTNGYWWFELTNELPSTPVKIAPGTQIKTLTLGEGTGTSSYIHFILIGAGAANADDSAPGAYVEGYFNITNAMGVGGGTFQLETVAGNTTFTFNPTDETYTGATATANKGVIDGNGPSSGTFTTDNTEFAFYTYAYAGPVSIKENVGTPGYSVPSNEIYGGAPNLQAQTGYWWYELSNSGPPTTWSSKNGGSYPINTKFFSGYSFLNYIIVAGGSTDNAYSSAIISASVNLNKLGQDGIINFDISPNENTVLGDNVTFTYTDISGNVLSSASSQCATTGDGISSAILPYDLYSFIKDVVGNVTTDEAQWSFSLSNNDPPPALLFDSNSGIYPNDFTKYANFHYFRYVLIGAGSTNGGSGSLVDVYVNIEKAGLKNILTLVKGVIGGDTVHTSMSLGSISVAQASGDLDGTGGIPIPPTDEYSFVNRSIKGPVSGSYEDGSSLGLQGLDGNYYGFGGQYAGTGYWAIEFTNREPSVSIISNTIVSLKTNPQTNSPYEFSLNFQLPKITEITSGPLSILPISILDDQIDGGPYDPDAPSVVSAIIVIAVNDISGAPMTLNFRYVDPIAPETSGTWVSTLITYTEAGLLYTGDVITYSIVVKRGTTTVNVLPEVPEQSELPPPGKLVAALIAEEQPAEPIVSTDSKPRVVLIADGQTGSVKAALSGCFGTFQEGLAAKLILRVGLNDTNEEYDLTMPLQVSGNSLQVDPAFEDLNDAQDLGDAASADDFSPNISATYDTVTKVLTWITNNFTPVDLIADFPTWDQTKGVYGLFLSSNGNATFEEVINPSNFSEAVPPVSSEDGLTSGSFDFSLLLNKETAYNVVVAASDDGINLIYSDMVYVEINPFSVIYTGTTGVLTIDLAPENPTPATVWATGKTGTYALCLTSDFSADTTSMRNNHLIHAFNSFPLTVTPLIPIALQGQTLSCVVLAFCDTGDSVNLGASNYFTIQAGVNLEYDDISGNIIWDTPSTVVQAKSWNLISNANYGIYASNDAKQTPENVITDVKNLLTQQDATTYTFSKQLGYIFQRRVFVGFESTGNKTFYSNYITINSGVNLGYISRTSTTPVTRTLMWSSTFTPIPIVSPLDKTTKKLYLVYSTSNLTKTVNEMLTYRAEQGDLNPVVRITQLDQNLFNYNTVAYPANVTLRTFVVCSPDGINLYVSNPIIYTVTAHSALSSAKKKENKNALVAYVRTKRLLKKPSIKKLKAGGTFPKIKKGDTVKLRLFTLDIGNTGSKTVYRANYPTPLDFIAACLVKGTEVLTPSGYVKIESIKSGDFVTNHKNKTVKVTNVACWRVMWSETPDEENVVYRVEKGTLGATKPLFISSNHQILVEGVLKNASNAGLPLAKKEEICENDGFYTFYNVQLENHELNHLVVNGGVVVESWDGKYPYEKKDAPLTKNPISLN